MNEPFQVLIVDDEDDLLSTLIERLEFRGIKAVGAQTGTQALEEFAKQEFDIAVLDVKLKGEDGVEVMKRLRQVRPNLPVILLTGHMSPSTSQEGFKAGATDFVLKPINLEDLIIKMQEAIEAHRGSED